MSRRGPRAPFIQRTFFGGQAQLEAGAAAFAASPAAGKGGGVPPFAGGAHAPAGGDDLIRSGAKPTGGKSQGGLPGGLGLLRQGRKRAVGASGLAGLARLHPCPHGGYAIGAHSNPIRRVTRPSQAKLCSALEAPAPEQVPPQAQEHSPSHTAQESRQGTAL